MEVLLHDIEFWCFVSKTWTKWMCRMCVLSLLALAFHRYFSNKFLNFAVSLYKLSSYAELKSTKAWKNLLLFPFSLRLGKGRIWLLYPWTLLDTSRVFSAPISLMKEFGFCSNTYRVWAFELHVKGGGWHGSRLCGKDKPNRSSQKLVQKCSLALS